MLHVLLNLTRSGSALIRVQYLVISFCLSETHNVYLNRWVVDLASAHARHTISVLLDETYLVMRLKPDCISGLPIRLESNDVFCFRVNRGIVNPILFCLTGKFSTVSYGMKLKPDCISSLPIHLESNDLSFASKSIGGLCIQSCFVLQDAGFYFVVAIKLYGF